MLWDETERSARGCSYVFGVLVAFIGLVSLITAGISGDWVLLASYLVGLGVFAGCILMWILVVGSIFAAFLCPAKCIADCVNRFRKEQSG
jgi:hypothetical protein